MILAHPLTEAADLGVAPAVIAVGAAALVGLGGVRARRATARAAAGGATPAAGARPSLGDRLQASLEAPLDRWRLAGRLVGGALLVLAVAAGRFGDPDQLDNVATPLVVGAGWPLLLLATALLGDVWGWGNPLDALGRAVERLAGRPISPEHGGDRPSTGTDGRPISPEHGGDRPSTGAWVPWLAVVGAAGLTWWLGVELGGLQPRAIGLALGGYALVVLALVLLVGRPVVLGRAEVLTVLFGAIAAARRGLVRLDAPHATALAVLAGGLTWAEWRFSRWVLGDAAAIGFRPDGRPLAVIGWLVLTGLAVLAVRGARRWAARRGGTGAVDAALPWLVVGLGLSAAVERDRLWTSVQLLGQRATTPFGGGETVLLAFPGDEVARVTVQLALLVVPAVVGVLLARRREGGDPVEPAAALVAGWVLLATLSAAAL